MAVAASADSNPALPIRKVLTTQPTRTPTIVDTASVEPGCFSSPELGSNNKAGLFLHVYMYVIPAAMTPATMQCVGAAPATATADAGDAIATGDNRRERREGRGVISMLATRKKRVRAIVPSMCSTSIRSSNKRRTHYRWWMKDVLACYCRQPWEFESCFRYMNDDCSGQLLIGETIHQVRPFLSLLPPPLHNYYQYQMSSPSPTPSTSPTSPATSLASPPTTIVNAVLENVAYEMYESQGVLQIRLANQEELKAHVFVDVSKDPPEGMDKHQAEWRAKVKHLWLNENKNQWKMPESDRKVAWHKSREVIISASKAAVALNVDPWMKIGEFLSNRVTSTRPEMNQFSQSNCDHGSRHESDARILYSLITGNKLVDIDFTCVMSGDPKLACIGATPDGICANKRLLVEIKCPARRVFGHSIQLGYFCQVQIQMACLGVPAAHFVQYQVPGPSNGWTARMDILRIPFKKDWVQAALCRIEALHWYIGYARVEYAKHVDWLRSIRSDPELYKRSEALFREQLTEDFESREPVNVHDIRSLLSRVQVKTRGVDSSGMHLHVVGDYRPLVPPTKKYTPLIDYRTMGNASTTNEQKGDASIFNRRVDVHAVVDTCDVECEALAAYPVRCSPPSMINGPCKAQVKMIGAFTATDRQRVGATQTPTFTSSGCASNKKKKKKRSPRAASPDSKIRSPF
jgi:putative phage-type endonuclease